MCGIAGILHRRGGAVDRQRLERMGRLLDHRGPDDRGLFLEDGIGLVHRRLSILDLSPRGRQPMDEGCVLVYNGEIYNYRELRSELESRGHAFRSDTDSEVLLRSYLEWGEGCVERFNGMWAFALWDRGRRRLFCSRDRLGVKPFYYAERGDEFVFASEPKALLVDPELRSVRPETLLRFLSEGLVDDEPATFYAELAILPAAHSLVLEPRGVRRFRYWSLDEVVDVEKALAEARRDLERCPAPESLQVRPLAFDLPVSPPRGGSPVSAPNGGPPPRSETPRLEEAAEQFRHLLMDSIRLRMRSDVPVGTCLSGGLDSSSIVCLASSMLEQPVSTFSSIYPQDDCNEGFYVERVVEACRTRATRVYPTAQELPEIFERLCWHQDEPTGGPGLYSQWKVMESARGQVTVLLDGQGGDELLAGYHHYFQDYLTTLARRLVRGRLGAEQLWQEVQVIEHVTGRSHAAVAQRALRRARRPRWLRFLSRERPGRVKPPAYVTQELYRQGGRARRTAAHLSYDELVNQKLYNDLTLHSIPALLRYEDRNSMAFSLEARVPFLDYRVVEFCFRLPAEFKIRPPHTKVLLRKAMEGRLPPEVLERQDKMGYPTPAAQWFRGPLRPWVESVLRSQRFARRGLVRPEGALQVLSDHLEGRDRSWELWRFLALEEWMRLFIDGEGFRGS